MLSCMFSQMISAQSKIEKKINPNVFDEKAALLQAKAKGISAGEIKGYLQFLKNDFSSKNALAKQPHKYLPYEGGGSQGSQETVIILDADKPMSLGCPNMGFEQYNFNGWTGGTGSVSIGANYPNYNSLSSSIVNPAGNNISLINSSNFHTIMTLPPINPVYPNCFGYDSIACKAVGSQTISQIPFVSPFSFDPVSVRMNGASADYRACKLKYITTTSSTNQRLSYSYALVFHDPTGTIPVHSAGEAPYFKVTVKNETTNAELAGCSSYSFNPIGAQPSDSLKVSVTAQGDPVLYRKWAYYSVDLSSLAPGTLVSINFEVGGCTNGGHYSYAYVDAECGGIGTPYANMCAGSNFATLIAPTGFSSYQWYDPSGLIIAGATNDTLIQNPATAGTTYSVNMVSPGGCTISQTVTINFTTVNIINLNSNSSCAGGNSGSASVLANGSNGAYTYSWTNTSTGTIVSNSQTATGLASGTYSVLVASAGCGQASANLSVGFSPPFFANLSKTFCGNAAIIPQQGGSNYVWYHGNTIVPSPLGDNDTLFVNPALDGDIYKVVYLNSQGCRDSLIYTLNQVSGGNTYFSNTNDVCPNDINGTTVINLNSPFPAPYDYIITGPTAANTISNTVTSLTSLTLTGLAPGTYTALVSDGTCIYNNSISISVIQTNFTVTPKAEALCFPQEATLNIDFPLPPACGLDPLLCSSGLPATLFSSGLFTQNSDITHPTPYGNYYTKGKSQFLIRKAELNAAGINAGKISSLAFNILDLNASELNYPDFYIKIGCTNLSNLPNASASDQPFVSGLQTIYSNSNQPIVLGWNTYNFSQSYLWDGLSNIVVEICFDFPGTFNFSENASVQLKQVSYVAAMYHLDDETTVCNSNLPADNNGILMTNGRNMLPNMRFDYCPYVEPSSYTVSVSSNGTITSTFANNDSIKIAPTFTTPPTGNGSVIYTISVTNPIGNCREDKTVEVFYPPLTTTVTPAFTTTTLCAGESTTLSAAGGSDYTWEYYQNGSLTQIATTYSVSVTPPSGTNVYSVTGVAPCPGSIPDTKTITVNVTALANLVIAPLLDITKCLNKDFVFTANVNSSTPLNDGKPYSYSWTTLPGNVVAPGINTAASYTTSNNTTSTLVITVNGVCANSTSDTVVVKNLVDDLSIAITNSVITCPNKALTLNSITVGGYPAYSYYWSVNSTTVSNLASLNYTSAPTGGTYSVGITVIDSCGYQNFDTDVVVVLPNTLNVVIVDSVSVCGNTPFTLNAIANGGYPDYSYIWSLNSDVISNNPHLSFTTPAAEGSYSVFVTASDSCGYQATDIEIINVLPPCMVIIPNIITPNGDNVNEYFKLTNLEYHPNTSVIIFDRWGKKVYENSNYNNEWKAEGVSDGTFFYIIDVPEDKKYTGFVTVFKGK